MALREVQIPMGTPREERGHRERTPRETGMLVEAQWEKARVLTRSSRVPLRPLLLLPPLRPLLPLLPMRPRPRVAGSRSRCSPRLRCRDRSRAEPRSRPGRRSPLGPRVPETQGRGATPGRRSK